MKQIKLKKTDLNKTPAELLIKLGAVNATKTAAYPNHVYLSKEDYKTLVKNYTKALKKEAPYLNAKKLASSVGYEFLNLGPSQLLEAAIRPGYAIVDDEGIATEIQAKEEQASRDELLKKAGEIADQAKELIESGEAKLTIWQAIKNLFKNLIKRGL
jgi:hypothetical protein